MDTKLIENIQTLKGFAEDLVVAQKAYATAIRVAQERVGHQKLAVSLFESDAAYRAYRRVERRYVKKYVGETADAESVWGAIVAGEAFPSFPYVWLPGNEYGWWDVENPTTRAWWVKETLLQAGWERDGDQWFPPSPSEEDEEETEKED